MAKIVINDSVKERSSSIVVNELEDFVQLCTIKKVTLSEDNKYYEIEVENEQGLTNTSRFYLPKDESEYQSAEKFKMAENIYIRNVTNLYRRFAGPTAVIEANDYVDLISKVIAKITPMPATKKVYTLFELNENDNGIFTRIAGIVPFADNKSDHIISKKQRALLEKKQGAKATPTDDQEFMKTPESTNGKTPF